MTIAAVLKDGAARLAAAGIESARLDARVLLAEVLQVSPGTVRSLSRDLTGNERAAYDALLGRRAAREPLAYVIGRKEFWSLDFAVGPGALVPRPETETLIEEALKAFPDRTAPLRILDLGTGSGCLLVTALTLYPAAQGTGLDRSAAALDWARRNAVRHGVAPRTIWIEGNWEAAGPGPFDLILANPPYLAQSEMTGLAAELAHEPACALESGPEGLEAYRALAPLLAGVLVPGGRAFLEIGAGQGEAVGAVLAAAGLENLGLTPDLSGIPRVVAVRRPGPDGSTREKSVGKHGPGL